MEVNQLVFETSASTDSAIWATFLNCDAKVSLFFEPANFWGKKFKYFLSDRNMRKFSSVHKEYFATFVIAYNQQNTRYHGR